MECLNSIAVGTHPMSTIYADSVTSTISNRQLGPHALSPSLLFLISRHIPLWENSGITSNASEIGKYWTAEAFSNLIYDIWSFNLLTSLLPGA